MYSKLTGNDVQILERFLMSVEQQAFRMAMMAVRNEADALDIVQESMLKLSSHYTNKAVEELKPLFYCILHNCINDWHRKETRWRRWFARDSAHDEDEHEIEDDECPVSIIENAQTSSQILAAIELLPLKQQQCFMLRCWEGFSTEETAKVMNISQGSVKTHYHRATQKVTRTLVAGEL